MSRKFTSVARKQQILSVARTLFANKGYAATTLDDIARNAGITRPRVLQLFGSKQRIYETIAETAYQDHPIDQDLAEHIDQKDDFAVFETFALHILQHTRKKAEREIFKILMDARLKEDRFHRIHFHRQDTLMISRLEEYVHQRIGDGAFTDMDPRVIIYAYQAMISNLAIYKNVMQRMDFVTIADLSRDCARIFLDGVAVNSAPVAAKAAGKRKE